MNSALTLSLSDIYTYTYIYIYMYKMNCALVYPKMYTTCDHNSPDISLSQLLNDGGSLRFQGVFHNKQAQKVQVTLQCISE